MSWVICVRKVLMTVSLLERTSTGGPVGTEPCLRTPPWTKEDETERKEIRRKSGGVINCRDSGLVHYPFVFQLSTPARGTRFRANGWQPAQGNQRAVSPIARRTSSSPFDPQNSSRNGKNEVIANKDTSRSHFGSTSSSSSNPCWRRFPDNWGASAPRARARSEL